MQQPSPPPPLPRTATPRAETLIFSTPLCQGRGGESTGLRTPTPPPQGASGQQLVLKGSSLRRLWAPRAPDVLWAPSLPTLLRLHFCAFAGLSEMV